VATAPGESPAAEAETFSIEVTRTKRRLSEIDEDLDRREARIARYSDERDAKIAILKDKRRYANNNLAGATWQESLASEMQAIATQYDTKINSQQQKIDDLQEESRLLKDKLASS
jgi:predicted RNase H-like nuclease (RuvC/YqgF family)